MFKVVFLVSLLFLTVGCGGNPYLDASLDAAELGGKKQAWFVEHWGEPHARSSRFFGGETWTYVRIAGGERHPPFYNFTPNECRIELEFDEEGNLDNYNYSDC